MPVQRIDVDEKLMSWSAEIVRATRKAFMTACELPRWWFHATSSIEEIMKLDIQRIELEGDQREIVLKLAIGLQAGHALLDPSERKLLVWADGLDFENSRALEDEAGRLRIQADEPGDDFGLEREREKLTYRAEALDHIVMRLNE